MASDLRDLKRQERQLLATFEGARKFLQKFKAEKHIGQVESRLELLETAMKKFYTVRRKIELLVEDADEKESTDSKEAAAERATRVQMLAERREAENVEVMQSTEDLYCELKSSLQALLPKPIEQPVSCPTPTIVQAAPETMSRVKLPEIRLPSFSGRTSDWVTFRDMFQSLIHNNNQLSAMDKFSYLRSSLVGESLQEIESIEMTVANYEIAWDLLKKRYENRKLIVKAHLDALFAVEPMKRESYDGLNQVISEFDKNLQMLEKVGENSSQWSTVLAHMMCSRLDQITLRHWESHHSSKEVPKYDELVSFLRNHCSVLQSIAPLRPAHAEVKKSKFSVVHASTQSFKRCPFCGESPHSAFKCQKFLKLRVSERYEKVKRSGLCLNCFSPTHLVRVCTRGVCQHCQTKHHTLLHNAPSSGQRSATSAASQNDSSVPRVKYGPQAMNTPQTQSQAQNQTTPTQHTSQSTSSYPIANTNSQHTPNTTDQVIKSNCFNTNIFASTRQVLLSTAIVRVSDMYGNIQLARALLDSCSEYCFITTNLSQKLKLVEGASYLSVAGIGGSVVKSTRKVEATIAARSFSISSYVETVQLHVLPRLTSKLPLHAVNLQNLAIPDTITLADPEFHQPGPIDLIIGAEYYYDLLMNERMKLTDDGPTLQKTVFGWVVSGRIPGSKLEVPRTITHSCSTHDLRELLAKFWEVESCNIKSTHSEEESTCEELYERTTVRDSEGKFVVTLPKKDYVISQLGGSKSIALKRFYGLERRFATNEELRIMYSTFMNEYISMGHMQQVHEEASDYPSYYMPHHAVLKPDSTTTKLRVVFDASRRTSSGISLNDGLMAGPVVQEDLLSIILRFRFRQFVLVADVAKMYRMVKVVDADQSLQRILWRSSPTEPVKSFQLTTVTYGTASAPYLATKSLQKLASEGEATHKAAARVIKKDFYVDDMLTGTDDLEEAKALAAEIIQLMNSAGFTLRKWNSNSAELLSTIPQILRDDRATLELDSSTSPIKTLGLIWQPASDNFLFVFPQWNPDPTITKRVVLSDTARIFDPLGLIGPVTVLAKIFLQDLWKHKADWDDPLPEDLQTFWNEYRRNIAALETLTVPRWTCYTNDLKSVELHGFCDASEAAYGACLYLRCEMEDGSVTVRLITSKSRVAPLEDLSRKKKKLSIPRLELSSALLLSHLYEKLRSSIELPANAYFWTDSMIVKCWLSSLPSRWQIFIANRVSEIQHLTKNGVWSHLLVLRIQRISFREE
ncbi:uncharacterized protein LOC129717231 [Wyeomyia smithii]|uniref:uncharacterized protein LOC129717231 n=1 Tax=Wyeomyia smithii TaxID=174621 RepID=UPI002467F6CE|nr:uncharacterized protein LOC129717231 [Wyeomyia smithii]